jgi:hypothetical protein
MNDKLNELIENKNNIDLAFNVMLVKIEFLKEQKIFEQDEAEGQKWFDIAVADYEKVKCGGCCNQE